MSDKSLKHILGWRGRDPGCQAAFKQLDAYCEAVQRGEDVSHRFAQFLTHIRNCAACREDTEGLVAILEELERDGPKG
jgi:hypothetical protein